MHCQTFSKKLKVIFLPISIILCVIPIKFETLKPPTVHLQSFAPVNFLSEACMLPKYSTTHIFHLTPK
jgi:hypothetical protein